jgi:uncharacterized membrane protein
MSIAMSIAVTLHLLGAVVWVGGMFFSHLALRPAAQALLEPPQRLALWARVLGGFFPWVWAAIGVLLASGYWMIFAVLGGMAGPRLHVHLMNGTGLLMILVFLHIYFAPLRRLRRAVAVQDWGEAGRSQGQIRRLMSVNLVLGLLTVVLAAGGRYLA